MNPAYNAFSGGLNQTLGKGIGWRGEKFGSSALTSFAAGLGGTSFALAPTIGAVLPWIRGARVIGSMFGLFDDGPPKTRRGQRSTTEFTDCAFRLACSDDRQDQGAQITAAAFAQTSVTAANELF